ncbi:MAG: hypothetical protein J6B12_05265 [Clostridia bacterium]|nr:hypothetical protein [Clostridia bacterium]
MKTARILSLFLAFLMLLSVFTACGNTPDESSQEQTKTPADTGNDRDLVEDGVPELNYNDETVTFLVRTGTFSAYEIACEELMNDPLLDAIHYRNIDVETRLGVKIKSVAQAGNFEEHAAWNNTLSVSVLTNTGDFDGCLFYLSTGSALAKNGIYYDLLQLTEDDGGYYDFNKPWWNKSIVNELGVFGRLFFAGGSLTVSQVSSGICLFFNRELFNEKYPDVGDATLYQLVRDGKWTADQMTYYVSNVWDDVNSNGLIDNGDLVGIKSLGPYAAHMDAWVLAMGLNFTENDMYGEPEIVLFNSKTVPAYEKVRGVFNNAGGFVVGNGIEEDQTMFQAGNVMFVMQAFSFGRDLKASTIDYGVLPLPKYDEDQADYRTCFTNAASAFALCSNLSDERAEMLSAITEVLSAESYKQVIPVYYETVLTGHYSRAAADAEMYDRILDSFVFSFGIAYSTLSLGGISAIFRRLDSAYDIQNHIDSNKDSWEQKLDDLLRALEAVG